MNGSHELPKSQPTPNPETFLWIEPCAAVLVSGVCVMLGHTQLATTPADSFIFGALLGLVFWWGFGNRANSPGAGLIWGLGFAALVWLLIPAGMVPLLKGAQRSVAMVSDARARFPALVSYLIL